MKKFLLSIVMLFSTILLILLGVSCTHNEDLKLQELYWKNNTKKPDFNWSGWQTIYDDLISPEEFDKSFFQIKPEIFYSEQRPWSLLADLSYTGPEDKTFLVWGFLHLRKWNNNEWQVICSKDTKEMIFSQQSGSRDYFDPIGHLITDFTEKITPGRYKMIVYVCGEPIEKEFNIVRDEAQELRIED